MFKCGYCGSEYDTVAERSACERACEARRVREAKQMQAEAEKAEKENAIVAIRDLLSERDELDKKIAEATRAYQKKFGTYFSEDGCLRWLFPWVV